MRNNGRGARNFDRARHRCADCLPRLFKPNQGRVRQDFSQPISCFAAALISHPIPALLLFLSKTLPTFRAFESGPLLALKRWAAEGAGEGLVAELDGHFAAGVCQLKWTGT